MLKIIGLWMLFGLVIQMIGGIIGAVQDNIFERKTGLKYDTRYTDIIMFQKVSKINPFAKMIINTKDLNAKSVLIVVICNLYGYLIWPIYFPTVMIAYDEARKAFLIDNKGES